MKSTAPFHCEFSVLATTPWISSRCPATLVRFASSRSRTPAVMLFNASRGLSLFPLDSSLRDPFWFSLFVKGGNAFARFFGFARLHVILQCNIDIFCHRAGPKFFDQSFRLCQRARGGL